MNKQEYDRILDTCVRCGACKSFCPTYLTTQNETLGARGRIAMLGELSHDRLRPSKVLAEKIFSCMLCEACGNLCPTGINIPEMIYEGRARLKDVYQRGPLFRRAVRFSLPRLDRVFSLLWPFQKTFYTPVQRIMNLRYFPEIAARPFKNGIQVYKNIKKIGRAAIFAGCTVNYFYPALGNALTSILLAMGYEVVVFRGELCCGAPLRSMGFEQDAQETARKNIELFSRVRAEAIISLCPTCTLVLRDHYPVLTGNSLSNVMDINEFLQQRSITGQLESERQVVTYHDPCHLRHGLGVASAPRNILKSISGLEYVEMDHADACCGFAGLFSFQYREMSVTIGRTKMESIAETGADTVVTSCPGCVVQLEGIRRKTKTPLQVKHIVEIINESMQT